MKPVDNPEAFPALPKMEEYHRDQHEAARLLAKGLSLNEVIDLTTLDPEMVERWSTRREFELLVEHYRTRYPAERLGDVLARKFGKLDAETLGKTVLGTLHLIATLDPKDIQHPDGGWKRADEMPWELRQCLKVPATEKTPPVFYDKLKALQMEKDILLAMEKGKIDIEEDALRGGADIAEERGVKNVPVV